MRMKFAQKEERTQSAATGQRWSGDSAYDDQVRKAIISKFDAAIALVRLLPDDVESS
ncbi:MAG: hypothetical protein JRN68_08255 [Nitrososphaerota archaeon]|jgi:hypothetical protein|nr:hypothetical protein [Nitrososphaerota archaeon]